MTDAQRQRVLELHEQGMGYSNISKATGLSINTVKSFLQRRTRKGVVNKTVKQVQVRIPPVSYCRQCNCLLQQKPGHKQRLYCSDRCRMKWWNAHLKDNHQKLVDHSCMTCGKMFTAYWRKNRKYCSFECYIENRFHSNRT